jgi:XTP/dITP diphosphohydrolase
VFADVAVDCVADVEANWETIKAAEKQRTSVLEGIPLALPALALAYKVVGRASKVLPAEVPSASPPASTSEESRLGEALLELVRDARAAGVDPEQALRAATHRLADQIRAAENGA